MLIAMCFGILTLASLVVFSKREKKKIIWCQFSIEIYVHALYDAKNVQLGANRSR